MRVIGFVRNKREVEREIEDPLEREKRRKGWRQPAPGLASASPGLASIKREGIGKDGE